MRERERERKVGVERERERGRDEERRIMTYFHNSLSNSSQNILQVYFPLQLWLS